MSIIQLRNVFHKSGALLGLGAAALALTCLGACERGGGTTPTANKPASGATAERSYVFGVIAKSQSNPVFQAARSGAEQAARDLENDHPGLHVKIEWRTPTDEDAQKQAEYLAQLVSSGVDGVAISCSDAKILTGAINDAVSSGVEVVTFDSDAPESDRFAYYGIDDVEAGRAVMRELGQAMGGKGVVAILGGNQTAPNLQKRIEGVKAEAADNWPEVELKYTFYCQETAPDAAATVQREQQNNPDITGWAMVGGWPLFTKNALDGIYQNAKVVSVDHLREELQYVRDGQVQALVGQDCFGWGYESIMLLYNKVHNHESPEQVINTFELQIVTPANVEEYEGVWERWLKGGGG